MREKYVAISSGVGACRRICGLSPGPRDDVYEYDTSESEGVGMMIEARGVDAYRSCNSVRPSDITGVVA